MARPRRDSRWRWLIAALVACVGIGLVQAASVSAPGFSSRMKLLSPDNDDELGYSVATDGRFIVSGAHQDGTAPFLSRCARSCSNNDVHFSVSIAASPVTRPDGIGSVSAFELDPSTGRFNHFATALSPGATDDRFGYAVAMDGPSGLVVVSAHWRTAGGFSNAGAVYLYQVSFF